MLKQIKSDIYHFLHRKILRFRFISVEQGWCILDSDTMTVIPSEAKESPEIASGLCPSQ